jgi:hypothetical protein
VNKELEAFIDYLDAERDHVQGILERLAGWFCRAAGPAWSWCGI